MSGTEIIFSGVARIEIERTPFAERQWVSIKALDDDGNEIGEVSFFPDHKRGRASAPSITANCHIAITKSE